MASNLRVDSIVPSTSGNVSIGTATGGVTIPGNLGIAGALTYEDVTNIDSVGVITARSGVNVSGGEVKVGAAVTVSSGGVITSGVVTATSFVGSGANLTGVSAGGASNIAFNAGKGIDYSAQTASGVAGVTVTSEIFVHYEQGTFTPFLSAASSAPSVSYGAERGGRYTRIGNMVFYSIGLNIASYSGGSGDAYIGGFPYIGAGNPGWDGVHVFRDTAAIGLNSRTNTVGGWIGDAAVAGYPVLYIQSMSSTSNFGAAAVQASSMQAGRLTVHGQYHIG